MGKKEARRGRECGRPSEGCFQKHRARRRHVSLLRGSKGAHMGPLALELFHWGVRGENLNSVGSGRTAGRGGRASESR